jgi:hypothetical protein
MKKVAILFVVVGALGCGDILDGFFKHGGHGGRGGDGGSAPAARTMGVVGCSLTVNVMQGYESVGGMRMWPAIPAYGGQVVQSWTNTMSSAWQAFDDAVRQHGRPTDVWIMLCVFGSQGATAAEVQQVIANARMHAPGANIHITGEPLYSSGMVCTLAGPGGPERTDQLAQEAAAASMNVTYAGTFVLGPTEVTADTCHANTAGQTALGNQAVAKWGR